MPPYLSAAVSKLRVMGLPFLSIDCCLMPFWHGIDASVNEKPPTPATPVG
ncbi:hypothetical protein RISK_005284 [Rhodopirellula islandica]|uniref:Uncharacterized protein n=1 Tax=Rhodopirellula islandica TaxID=595434 RepID=A0A0J1B6J5_RHOIS|nr:hypothetical protein RISK_005284 [Rhodopirellula islandica]